MERQSGLIALVDTLSLVVCGELKTPIDIETPDRNGGVLRLNVRERPEHPFEFVVSPWPFDVEDNVIEGEARRLPGEGRFTDELSFRRSMASSMATRFRSRLSAG